MIGMYQLLSEITDRTGGLELRAGSRLDGGGGTDRSRRQTINRPLHLRCNAQLNAPRAEFVGNKVPSSQVLSSKITGEPSEMPTISQLFNVFDFRRKYP